MNRAEPVRAALQRKAAAIETPPNPAASHSAFGPVGAALCGPPCSLPGGRGPRPRLEPSFLPGIFSWQTAERASSPPGETNCRKKKTRYASPKH